VADGLEAAPPVQCRWHLGQGQLCLLAEADAPPDRSTGWSVWTRPSTAPISTRPTRPGSNSLRGTLGLHARPEPRPAPGAESAYRNPWVEPRDDAIGRSRGGLSTKIHELVDGRGCPLVVALTQARPVTTRCCSRCLPSPPSPGSGQVDHAPGPAAVTGDEAYSSRGTRAMLHPRHQSRHPAAR